MADSKVGERARAVIEQIWPALMDALETGEEFGSILEAAGVSRGAVRAYRLEDPAKDREWAMAREFGADAYADKINAIANNPGADANLARVSIQAWQWLAAKRNPRVYSDKTQIDMNVRTVDLTAIIQAANARLAAARQAQVIDGSCERVELEPAPALAPLL